MTNEEKAQELVKKHIFDSNHYGTAMEMAEWKEKQIIEAVYNTMVWLLEKGYIMNYEKKYKEALERAKSVHSTNVDENKKSTEYIFPELKESEDERMMNNLHSWMQEFGGAEEYTEKVYQWIKGLLEKQGETVKNHEEYVAPTLIDILKDVPERTKLYSPLFGECELISVNEKGDYPIKVLPCDTIFYCCFTEYGIYDKGYQNTECLLFPSKEQRDWSKFKMKN